MLMSSEEKWTGMLRAPSKRTIAPFVENLREVASADPIAGQPVV